MDSNERGMNPVVMTIINPRKEYWPKLVMESGNERFTLSQTTNFIDSSKLKEFADDIKFDENGKKFSKKIENTLGKGEIALYEQFLLFPQCFQKTCTADTKNPGLVWEQVHVKMVED